MGWCRNINRNNVTTMAQNGLSCESEERPIYLKRKRSSSAEDVENMPPNKISATFHLVDEQTHNVVVESSPCTSEESPVETQPRSNFTDVEYNPDSIFSPPSLPELPNCVLSPLVNVARDSTPHSNKRHSKMEPTHAKRRCPLPAMSWGEPQDVWDSLCERDVEDARYRKHTMFENHPTLEPKMRAILLDWLNEVCEVYKLHRETFHLAVEYFDRYLTNRKDVTKERLQLIGITCLFIAAKVEEVYPPQVNEFAFVTDRACTTEGIILQELNIMDTLKWNITPLTINWWLNLYIQLTSVSRNAKKRLISELCNMSHTTRSYTFTFPQYSSLEYVICMQLIDLAVLHVDVNKYNYSLLAAAAVAHVYNKELAMRVSGYSWEALRPCYRWMKACSTVTVSAGGVRDVRGGGRANDHWDAGALRDICPDLNVDDAHRLQTHNVTLNMFESLTELLQEQPEEYVETTESNVELTFPPTPPPSGQKSPSTPSTKTPSTRRASCDNES